MRIVPLLCLLSVLPLTACAESAERNAPDAATSGTDAVPAASTDPQSTFWASLRELCGQAFSGVMTQSIPPDNSFDGKALVMHVRECDEDTIRIPFFVGDDRSRTWVLSRTDDGLRLKHDHRHQDGSEDEVTQYGGDTGAEGSATTQEFPADAHTAEIVPAAATNVWTVEVHPGRTFVYGLRRVGSDRLFRVEFDLTAPVEEPPPPWGA